MPRSRSPSIVRSAPSAAGLFVFGLHVPYVSALAISALLLRSAPRLIARRQPTRRAMFAFLVLAAALASYYATAAGFGYFSADSAIGYAAVVLSAYVVGYDTARLPTEPRRWDPSLGLLAAVFGAVAFAAVSVLQAGPSDLARREAASVWGGLLMNAPGLGALGALGMVLAVVSIAVAPDNKAERWILWIAFPAAAAAGTYVNLALQNRTPFLSAAGAFVACSVLPGAQRDARSRRRIVRVWVSLLVAAVAVAATWVPISESGVMQRFENEGLRTARYEVWWDVLTQMLDYPSGGRLIPITERYAHNLWLDAAWDAGIVPFLLMGAFHLLHIRPLMRVARSGLHTTVRVTVIAIGVAFLFTCFSEPVLAMPIIYFALSTYYLGVVLALSETPA